MDYRLYQSKLIKDNYSSFVKNCKLSYEYIQQHFGEDSTWNYNKYNIFSITSSSMLFYNLYKELNYHVRSFMGDDQPLWIQSWLNYHPTDNMLDKVLGEKQGFHGHHDCIFHGYISIDPQNTVTKFRNGLEIKNKIGQIYIGPGNFKGDEAGNEWDHLVEIISPSKKPRITIGFDVTNKLNTMLYPSYIPLL